ncbi:MAG: type IV pilus twitching motility protein PilT [Myxococcota bacterium]|nr:type IV pilus twitching motility protein PilT [Myxococcota bacterium]
MLDLHQLLQSMVREGASDLHITCGSPPNLRIDGHLVRLKVPPLTPDQTAHLCLSVLNEKQKQHFLEYQELDFSFGVKNLCRFRANFFMQRGTMAAAFRAIPSTLPQFDQLGLPDVIGGLTARTRGLILVTGPTGSGKSTTLAAMLDKINRERHHHIITIEDPIEHIHSHKNCIVNQREIGQDTDGFKGALRYVLRQDPDVVLIGEMRDLETVQAALTISETGHLVLATLHTNSALQSINRIIDLFPPHQQSQVRAQLSFTLEAVVSQQLLMKRTGVGRVLAAEVMLTTPAIANLIREDKAHQIYSQMQVGQAKFGMQTMNQALFDLVQKGDLSEVDALNHSNDIEELNSMLQDLARSRS